MPDISMCGHEACPSRQWCYRNPASGTKPSEWRQAWMDFKPDQRGHCDHFSEVSGKPLPVHAVTEPTGEPRNG